MRRAAGLRVAAAQHAAAAAQFHDHHQPVAVIAHRHVAPPALAAEMPAAHAFHRQRQLLVRRELCPVLVAVAPDALVGLENRLQHRLLAPARRDGGQQVLHPGHQHVVGVFELQPHLVEQRDGVFAGQDCQSCGRTVSPGRGGADRLLAALAQRLAQWIGAPDVQQGGRKLAGVVRRPAAGDHVTGDVCQPRAHDGVHDAHLLVEVVHQRRGIIHPASPDRLFGQRLRRDTQRV